MEKEHYYPEDVVKEGNRYLNSNKISLVKWDELKKFVEESNYHPDFRRKVEKYCNWRAYTKEVLTFESYKNFSLTGENPKIEGVNLYFTKLETILEYKKETNQEKEHITIMID